MRNWRKQDDNNVIIVHCKAGKGRSGTAAVSYLISEEGWDLKKATDNFTEKRMRDGWGTGISIPSQQRYLTYVDRWRQNGKVYVERKVKVHQVEIQGLRDGVKVAIEGFIDEGKKIKTMHAFEEKERRVLRGQVPKASGFADVVMELMRNDDKQKPRDVDRSRRSSRSSSRRESSNETSATKPVLDDPAPSSHRTSDPSSPTSKPVIDPSASGEDHPPYPKKRHTKDLEAPDETAADGSAIDDTEASKPSSQGADVVFTPGNGPVLLETSDICIDIERKTRGAIAWKLPTSVAHVWFNTWFEGNGPELCANQQRSDDGVHAPLADGTNPDADGANPGIGPDTTTIATEGVFTIEWDAMDGLKGSLKKGLRAFDRVSVKWSALVEGQEIVHEPAEGEPVKQSSPADWKGEHHVKDDGGAEEEESDGNESGEEGTKTDPGTDVKA